MWYVEHAAAVAELAHEIVCDRKQESDVECINISKPVRVARPWMGFC